MTKLLLRLIISLFLLSGAAWADSIITNYNGGGTGKVNQITHYDNNNNKIAAIEGSILKVGSTFYMIGDYHGCGFDWTRTSPWCGARVYSSTDLKYWTDLGFLFDASTSAWQDRCAGGQGGGASACFAPKMVFNVSSGKYVLWLNQYGSPPDTAGQNNFVMLCDQPYSTPETIDTNCALQTNPSGFANSPVEVPMLWIDAGGQGYAVWSNLNTREIWAQALNADYTDATGPATDTGLSGEAPFMFARSGVYYVGVGALCTLCIEGSELRYVKASSALGTYNASTVLNANSCNGQPRQVDVIDAGGGNITYLYSADQYDGYMNAGLSNIYFQPLTFTGSDIDSFTCQTTVTIPGLTENPFPAQSPVPDQTDLAYGNSQDHCVVNDQIWRGQIIKPMVTPLAYVDMGLGQNGVGVNGDLTVQLTTLDGSNNPATVLASQTITGPTMSWSSVWTRITFNYAVTPGASYGLVIKGSNTLGCFTSVMAQPGQAAQYPAGGYHYTLNGGSTWTDQPPVAVIFSSYGPALVGGWRR